MTRVAVVGLGIIGKRLVHAIEGAPDLTLAGVAVRSAGPTVHAWSHLPYFDATGAAGPGLAEAGVAAAGGLAELLERADVVVDAGPARTGATRARRYAAAGVRVLYCGGERDGGLGPLVHPALNPAALTGPAARLTSCNTTALSRLVAAVGAAAVRALDVTVLRCATDTDKAGKGITNGAVLGPGQSHHAEDLRHLVPGLPARSWAVTLPMTCGHVIGVRLETTLRRDEVLDRLAAGDRIRVTESGQALDTAGLRAAAWLSGHRWGQRFDLTVLPVEADASTRPGETALWLSLDNESITVPETLDAVRLHAGMADAGKVRAVTDQHLAALADAADWREP